MLNNPQKQHLLKLAALSPKAQAIAEELLAKAQGTAHAEAHAPVGISGKKLLMGALGMGATGLAAGVTGAFGAATKEGIERLLKPKPSMFQNVRKAMGTAAGFGLGGLALGTGVYAADKGYTALTEPHEKARHFNTMMKENPTLKHEDQPTVVKSFNTLWHFNKDMAKDPTTSGAFVRRAAVFKDEGIQATDIKTLADIRKALSASHTSAAKGFLERGTGLRSFHDKD